MKVPGLAVTILAILVAGSVQAQKIPASQIDPVFETPAALVPQNRIDELVFAHWKQVGVEPSRLCSDAVFMRRAYLDVIGTLPTAAEAQKFLADPDPHKRSVLIDELLERDEFRSEERR